MELSWFIIFLFEILNFLHQKYLEIALETYSQKVVSSLSKVGLAPGSTPLLPKDFKLSTKLELKFRERTVTLGNCLKTGETKEAPTFSFASEGAQNYTLLLVDPDAPTPEEPKFAYWRHWVLPGLQPSSTGPVTLSKPALTGYLGPGAKDEKATPHRYIFLLFKEPEGFSLSESDVGGEEFIDRRSFKAAEFIEKHGLKLVSVNWFSGVGDSWKE